MAGPRAFFPVEYYERFDYEPVAGRYDGEWALWRGDGSSPVASAFYWMEASDSPTPRERFDWGTKVFHERQTAYRSIAREAHDG